jgi:hypothetical protein
MVGGEALDVLSHPPAVNRAPATGSHSHPVTQFAGTPSSRS